MLTAPVATATHATTTAVWNASGILTAPAAFASWAESVCRPFPMEPPASPTPGAHLVTVHPIYVLELQMKLEDDKIGHNLALNFFAK